MKVPWVATLCAALVCAAIAGAQVDPSGHWEGTVEVPSGPNGLALDLTKTNQGVWIGSLTVLPRASGLRVTEIRIADQKLKFSSPDVPGGAVFDLTLRDGKLAGVVSVQGAALPLEMRRTGDAKVEIPPAMPAVSKELEGDWEGSISLPNGQTRPVVVHLQNQADHTVAATIDSSSQGAKGLLLAGVSQTGKVVEFSVRTFGGSYKGTLNGAELTGEWTQNAGSTPLPLNLKKK
jgi:hypothetical protein